MSVLAVSFTAAIALLFVWGFTGPSQAPPGGSGLIHAYNLNIGIGTSTPGYKLTVAGNISAAFNEILNVASPVATSSVATKGYVDAQVGGKSMYLTSITRNGAHNCDNVPSTCCVTGYHPCYTAEMYGRDVENSGSGRDETPGTTYGDVRSDFETLGEDCIEYTTTTNQAGWNNRARIQLHRSGISQSGVGDVCDDLIPQWCCQD